MSYPCHIVELMTYDDAITPQLTECHDPHTRARRVEHSRPRSRGLGGHESKHDAPHISGRRAQEGLARKPSTKVLAMRCAVWVSA